jgi:hypothetical protein
VYSFHTSSSINRNIMILLVFLEGCIAWLLILYYNFLHETPGQMLKESNSNKSKNSQRSQESKSC